jgi:glycosyltransferase involved in cell wall biosynthesis
MRIVYINLQTNGFYVRDIGKIIKRGRAIPKHRFYLDWMLDNGVETVNLITKEGTLLPTSILRKVTNFIPFRIAETKFVLKQNGFSAVKNIFDPKLIKEDDIVICYSLFPNEYKNICNINAIKVVDHVHFFGDASTAELVRKARFSYYMYEVDLKKYSRLYERNYSWFEGEYINRPYHFEERFKDINPFEKRKTMAVAMGTHTECNMQEYIEVYGTNSYQPHRKMILDNASNFPNEIVSYISSFSEGIIDVGLTDNKLTRLYKKVHNAFTYGRQKTYFSFDMVETYNEYKMFICPEDINGSYGVGTLEGMACGCAMIGINIGIFEDMGLIAGRDYIQYDGTMDNLIEIIRYYQLPEHQDELAKVAKNGCEFVRKNYSKDAVAKKYYEDLKALTHKQ